ncbi:MAG: hypothetical protein QM698_00060 [Micropepsaceae bacterium]
MSKTLALAATALAAVLWTGAVVAQTTLPSIAQPKAGEGQTLTHASGYSITVPTDWLVATDAQGADFLMGNPDLSLVCFAFHENGVITATDADIKANLGTVDLGADFFTKILFQGAPDLAYEKTGPQADHASGWPFQRAVATLTADGTPSTAFAYITFKKTNAFYGFCYTATAARAANEPAAEAVIGSIRLAN